jgi:uncharacterized protein YodC (DUF2158 family)
MKDLKKGDKVKLNSGGPDMTIAGIDKYDSIKEKRALCQWFDGKEIKKAVFYLHTITRF